MVGFALLGFAMFGYDFPYIPVDSLDDNFSESIQSDILVFLSVANMFLYMFSMRYLLLNVVICFICVVIGVIYDFYMRCIGVFCFI